jgi:hypothetical protein
MTRFSLSSRSLIPLAVLLPFGLSSCGASIEIVRAPFISPIVVPAPDKFLMNAVVKNFGNGASDPLSLLLLVEYKPSAESSPEFVSYDKEFRLPSLPPGQSWTLKDYDVSEGHAPCVQGSCQGHIYLTLSHSFRQGDFLNGTNTRLRVSWEPSGALQDMRVVDPSDPSY